MKSQFDRTIRLIGNEKQSLIENTSVLVFGVGGVGGYVVECLVRAGTTRLGIVDNDTINITNLNRQILATHSSIGQLKVDVCANRIADINQNCRVNKYNMFVTQDNLAEIPLEEYDVIIDCIDNITAKIAIIKKAIELEKFVISSMGTGNKVDASRLKIDTIDNTAECPLARVMRRELKKINITKVPVLYSDEKSRKPLVEEQRDDGLRKSTPASFTTVPAVGGLLIANYVLNNIIKS